MAAPAVAGAAPEVVAADVVLAAAEAVQAADRAGATTTAQASPGGSPRQAAVGSRAGVALVASLAGEKGVLPIDLACLLLVALQHHALVAGRPRVLALVRHHGSPLRARTSMPTSETSSAVSV